MESKKGFRYLGLQPQGQRPQPGQVCGSIPRHPPPTTATARSWGEGLDTVVGSVYASSAKSLINAAGTENQFFKAEINNNN